MSKKNTRNVKRRLSKQKIFNAISAGFFLACCIFYGSRFIKLYLENKKNLELNEDALVNQIIEKNEKTENFKKINGNYYFNGKADNNYIIYSNILWRIVKINKDNTIKLISEDVLTYLPYDKNISNFKKSYISNWLNNKEEINSGILIKELDTKNMVNDNVCTDNIEKANNQECKKYEKDLYISLLSVSDYMNAGGSKSYLNISKNFYLSSIKDNQSWYISTTGKAETNDGNDIYGIRPTITLGSATKQDKGNGSKNDPYVINTDNKFASYVKLDKDIYRIYETDENNYKLSSTTLLKEDNIELEHIYSNKTYYHNDTDYGSLAYYLNNDYLKNLNYKLKIKNENWANGVLNDNLNYTSCLNTKIETKIATLSIGNILLNNLDNYFLMSGDNKSTRLIYKVNEEGSLSSIDVTDPAHVIPTIAISKESLKKGKGTIDEPYEMEE